MKYLLHALVALLLSACAGLGFRSNPSTLARLQNAHRTASALLDLAHRERPSAVLPLQALAQALDDAEEELSSGRSVESVALALGLIRAAIAQRPGGDLELGLIALDAILSDLLPALGPLEPSTSDLPPPPDLRGADALALVRARCLESSGPVGGGMSR